MVALGMEVRGVVVDGLYRTIGTIPYNSFPSPSTQLRSREPDALLRSALVDQIALLLRRRAEQPAHAEHQPADRARTVRYLVEERIERERPFSCRVEGIVRAQRHIH